MQEFILKKEIITNKIICRVLGILTFVILTALGGFVRIPLPFTPVPLTLQTFFVLLSGAFLGRKLGGLSQISYIFLGVLGLPIFSAAGSGLLYLTGPTGGYLIGFIAAALFLGATVKYCKNSLFLTFAAFCIADVILLCFGVAWLKVIFGLPFKQLFVIGFLPFVAGDLLKALVASSLYLKLRPRLNEIFF